MKKFNFIITGLFIAMILFIGVSLQPDNENNFADIDNSFRMNERTVYGEKIVLFDNSDSIDNSYIIFEFNDECEIYLLRKYFNRESYEEDLINFRDYEILENNDQSLYVKVKTGTEDISYDEKLEEIQGLIDSEYYLLIK